jgi:hypothetical protein
MERWVLLVLSGFAVYAVVETFRWLRMVERSSTQEVERVVGYDGSHLPGESREKLGLFARGRLSKICFILAILAVGLIVATVRAFLI